jgi:hypothetical protein
MCGKAAPFRPASAWFLVRLCLVSKKAQGAAFRQNRVSNSARQSYRRTSSGTAAKGKFLKFVDTIK